MFRRKKRFQLNIHRRFSIKSYLNRDHSFRKYTLWKFPPFEYFNKKRWCFCLQNLDMSHTPNLAQGLGLNSLTSSLLSNAVILNQNQQNHMQPVPSQSQQQHLSLPQLPPSQQQTHSNGSSSGNNNLIQTTSGNNLTNNNGSNVMNNGNGLNANNNTSTKPPTTATKKKKKKKPPKEKKPRPKPGEIRLTTALDGSTLYGCPECHMVYPGEL